MYRPAREGRSCEDFGRYKTVNGVPLPLPIFCVFSRAGKLNSDNDSATTHQDEHLERKGKLPHLMLAVHP